MRVIAGQAKGIRLQTPEGLDVRPTTDKVKEAVFSAIQFEIPGATCLDLFAGSGQIGIELLSRGAASVIFTDKSRKSLQTVQANLEKTKLQAAAQVFLRDSLVFLEATDNKFDIIYMDPPFAAGLMEQALTLAQEKLAQNGKIICEYPQEIKPKTVFEKILLDREYSYGKICIGIYKFKLI
ncbi:MAG: 16S rRNA (guanine(966)-N(2))-methyltransferase RsmD [Oscillospiraceae bacterium]|jgi:16S rRNA (guanine(966)-N(2))-methyltransferase RsmD|nr:16S rRNA (guanine(966)-N(2))-methyltransferase RsmD [Oscillospiraceae bacterium]